MDSLAGRGNGRTVFTAGGLIAALLPPPVRWLAHLSSPTRRLGTPLDGRSSPGSVWSEGSALSRLR